MIAATILGSGGATPYKARTTPMLTISSENASVLVDCGSGATIRLAEAGINTNSIDSLLFTHFHADHCVDFPVFVLTSYLAERRKPLKVLGPIGTKEFVKIMLDDLFPYIKRLVGAITGKEFEIIVEELEAGQVLAIEELEVHVEDTIHSVPALCYHFQTKDGSIAVSGDTEYSEKVIAMATDSDVLIHECPFPPSMGTIPDHTTATQVGEVASKAGVKTLVLTHLFEEVVGEEDDISQAIQANFSGEIVFAEDLMSVKVSGKKTTVSHLNIWHSLDNKIRETS
nr:MBL fold metallo-hydrolase [FCB group bacterium]